MFKRSYPLDLNIRLRPPGGRETTYGEIQYVLAQFIDEGVLPRGWKMAAIRWRNPAKATPRWRSGSHADLDAFLPVLRDMGLGGLDAKFRGGRVRQVSLDRAADRIVLYARKRKHALKQLARSKRPETRRKWREAADEARAGWQEARALYQRETGGRGEYEIAGSYE